MASSPFTRRALLGGLAAAGTAAALAGCSSGSGSGRPSGAPTGDKIVGKTNLDVWVWTNGPTIDANFKKRVDLFNEEMHGKFTAKITFLPYDQFWQKIDLQYAAHKPFDMYYWDVQAYAHYLKHLIEDVQPVVNQSPLTDGSKYPAKLFDPWRFDGKDLYAIPENIQSMALFYNKTHFDQAGLSYPDESWTWDQVIETAPKLHKTKDGKVTRWGLDIGDLGVWWGIQTLSWAAGTAWVDKPLEPTKFQLTDQANVAALKFVQDLMWAKHVAPRPAERDALNQQQAGFASGAISMNTVGTWNIASYQQMKDKWGMAPLPKYQGNSVAPYWLGGWVIPKQSAALSAAQTFAIWSATKFQEQMAKDHDWIPIQNAARESKDMLDGMPNGFGAAMKALPNARIGDIYTRNEQQIYNEVFSTNLDQLYHNKLSPQAAAQKMQGAATKLLSS